MVQLKHFLYRSESSRDSRVETSRSGEILKKLYLSLFFNLYRSNSRCLDFQTVFYGFCVFPFSLMFCIIRSKFFDLYCSFADYNKHILCTSLRQLKVSLKLTYYVLLFNTMHNVLFYRKNKQTCFKLDEGENMSRNWRHALDHNNMR